MIKGIIFSGLMFLVSSASWANVISNVEVPDNVKNNEKATIHLSGILPNSCYKMGETKYSIFVDSDGRREINIKVDSNVSRMLCLQIVLPFEQDVELGYLAPGNYKLSVSEDQQPIYTGQLVIFGDD